MADEAVPEAIQATLRRRSSREWKEYLATVTFEDERFVQDWIAAIRAAALDGKKWAADVLMKLIEEPATTVVNNLIASIGAPSESALRDAWLDHQRINAMSLEEQVRVCEEFILRAHAENPEIAADSVLAQRALPPPSKAA